VATVDICGDRVGGGGQCDGLSSQRKVEGRGLQRDVVYHGVRLVDDWIEEEE
jgi:hypothetical protein